MVFENSKGFDQILSAIIEQPQIIMVYSEPEQIRTIFI